MSEYPLYEDLALGCGCGGAAGWVQNNYFPPTLRCMKCNISTFGLEKEEIIASWNMPKHKLA